MTKPLRQHVEFVVLLALEIKLFQREACQKNQHDTPRKEHDDAVAQPGLLEAQAVIDEGFGVGGRAASQQLDLQMCRHHSVLLGHKLKHVADVIVMLGDTGHMYKSGAIASSRRDTHSMAHVHPGYTTNC